MESLLKHVILNSLNIDEIIKYVNKQEKFMLFGFLVTGINIVILTSTTAKHEKEIERLKQQIKDIEDKPQTKGE